MKTMFITMAALSALSVAAPASAQRWGTHTDESSVLRAQIDSGIASGAISERETMPLHHGLRQLISLERQFAAGGVSRREQATLRQLGASLSHQIDAARRSPHFARNDSRDQRASEVRYQGERRSAWEASYDREHRAEWENRYLRDRNAAWEGRFAGQRTGNYGGYGANEGFGRDRRVGGDPGFSRPNRGDRFAGDVRVGQRPSFRMIALPDQYREQFPDDAEVYYRYDDRRVYQIDRLTDTVLALLDIGN